MPRVVTGECPARKIPQAQLPSCQQQPSKLKLLIGFYTFYSQTVQSFKGVLAGGESGTEQGSGCIFPLLSLSTELIPEPKRAPEPQCRAGPAPQHQPTSSPGPQGARDE